MRVFFWKFFIFLALCLVHCWNIVLWSVFNPDSLDATDDSPYNPHSSGARDFLLPFLQYYCSLCVAGSRCWKAETNFLLPQTLYSITPKVLVTRTRLLSLPYSLHFCFRRPSTTRTNIILAYLKHGALGEFIISLLAVQFHLIAVQ
jgi:hypothetical protein